jgi:hypothetical protein
MRQKAQGDTTSLVGCGWGVCSGSDKEPREHGSLTPLPVTTLLPCQYVSSVPLPNADSAAWKLRTPIPMPVPPHLERHHSPLSCLAPLLLQLKTRYPARRRPSQRRRTRAHAQTRRSGGRNTRLSSSPSSSVDTDVSSAVGEAG